METKKWILGFLMCAVILVFLGGGFMCCMALDKITVNDPLRECTYSNNVMKVYSKSADKSGAVTAIENCVQCMKKLRCQENAFGYDDEGKLRHVDYSDPVRKNYYNQCLAEK